MKINLKPFMLLLLVAFTGTALAQNVAAPLRRPDNLDLLAPDLTAPAVAMTDQILAESRAANAWIGLREREEISDKISRYWNRSSVLGMANFEQYVVRITVEVSALGRVESVTPLEPSRPEGIFDIAYRAARSAVLQADRAGGIPLPEGKFPNGVTLVLRFDPASGEIGFN